MLGKINRLKNWQASTVIILIGFLTYFRGLTNPFEGDDVDQIVNNPVVHSISHIILLFKGSTFYNGGGINPLSGIYYRPLMSTTFSILYTLFGPHPFYFHIFQLALCIGSAIVLYLFFRYSFNPILSLFLSLVFLVHPIDSQTVFAIPSMQDALFFFTGILALYILVRFQTVRSLMLVAILLFLSLLSKETGILFVFICLLYLFWWDRRRLYKFIAIMIVPIGIWLALKINAVGLFGRNPSVAPIDSLNLVGRLMNLPSVVLFYISKFIFPWKLASSYYWAHGTFSVRNFLVPLFIDLIVAISIAYAGLLLYKNAVKSSFYTYLFFAVWFVLGLLAYSQIIPLDFTVTEPWFYFSMAGLLGMIGMTLKEISLHIHLNKRLVISIMAVILLALGVRTIARASDWSSEYILAKHDIVASGNNYSAENQLAIYYSDHGEYKLSKSYAERSVSMYPTATNNNSLGIDLFNLKDYAGAYTAWNDGLKYEKYYYPLYSNLALLTPFYGNSSANLKFLLKTIQYFPKQPQAWFDLAILEYRYGYDADAKTAITQAYHYGSSYPSIKYVYQLIMDNKPI